MFIVIIQYLYHPVTVAEVGVEAQGELDGVKLDYGLFRALSRPTSQ